MQNQSERPFFYLSGDPIGPPMKNLNQKIESKLKKSNLEVSKFNTTNTTKCSGGNERRVLVLYTGGTIGMVANKHGALAPQKGIFQKLIRGYPQLHDNSYFKQSEANFDTSFMVLPESKDLGGRIIYKMIEYEILLDSSNMAFDDWIQIAEDVMKYYDQYDGFVVLHGTDTLSYTASALSFMFENIGKSIVLTGSQIPIFEPRSDGSDNLVSSLLIAGGLNIPEVTVFFGNKLYRGNRTRKISANNLNAFSSPNCVPLVEVGIDFEVNKKAIFKPTNKERCHLHAKMSKNVGLLRIFPSISTSLIRAFFQPPIEGVVLESYGAGNIPSNREDLLTEISAAVKRGMIVVNITQCLRGGVVAAMYETGKFLSECGVVSGYDMTPEAALAKLSYVLSKTELTYQQKVDMMVTNIRGELTKTSSISIEDDTLLEALALTLNIESQNKLVEVTEKVFNALLLYAIGKNDVGAVKMMLDMGANINTKNSDGSTVLHEAVLKGNMQMIEYLLKNGAEVNIWTRCGESPLLAAIHKDNVAVICLLQKYGACLSSEDRKIVADMSSLAARCGDLKKLKTLIAAGLDLSAPDEIGQNLLHKAVLCNNPAVVRYLLSQGVDKETKDILGFTPMDCAIKLELTNIIDMLK